MTHVPNALLTRFAADPTAGYAFEDEAWAVDSPSDPELEAFLASLDPAVLEETRCDQNFIFFNEQHDDLDRAARIWVGWRALRDAIASHRINCLYNDSAAGRRRPYDQLALSDLTPDSHNLVPLTKFGFTGSALRRNGHAFQLMSTTPAPNSTYWLLLEACRAEPLRGSMMVRPDPLLHGPAGSFPTVGYTMLGYGNESLDWERIANLKEPEHGQWLPDDMDQWGSRTDWVWEPRGSEIHFRCEEIPSIEDVTRNPGRYLHAIFVPSADSFIHLDGAVRIYGPAEIRGRHSKKLHQAGKVGLREKVFSVDAPISRSLFSVVAQTFFVWNSDVVRYFQSGDAG
ncbi:hypothetical protein [Candidatus Palauibacter sp.]|uniref:hypothetical protein n=1 Tax=Candidatus Palauibacter sp. TaxID=3101350 RepID=UPI003B011D4A